MSVSRRQLRSMARSNRYGMRPYALRELRRRHLRDGGLVALFGAGAMVEQVAGWRAVATLAAALLIVLGLVALVASAMLGRRS